MKKYLSIAILAITLFFGCAKEIKLSTFSELPKDVAACNVTFARNADDLKTHKFIFVNSFKDFSYISVNNTMLKLMSQKARNIKKNEYYYANEQFTLKLVITEEKTVNEYDMQMKGIVTITGKSGEETVIEVVGEGGC